MNTYDTESILQTQKELSELVGCSGREKQVRSYIRAHITQYVDSVEIDDAGNLIAIKYGTNKNAPTVLLDAHMDEVGFIVNHIEPDGFVRVSPLGGIDPSLLPGTAVQFVINGDNNVAPETETQNKARITAHDDGLCSKRVVGTFGSIPPHVKGSLGTNGNTLKIENMTIDVGAASDAEVRELGIEIGSTGTFFTPFQQLSSTSIMGKAFDNRSGCNVLLQTAARIAATPIQNTVIFLFSTAEEHKQLGAGSVVFSYIDFTQKINAAIVIENTTATDTAGTPAHFRVAELGKGPAITLADTKYIVPERIVKQLTECAGRNSISYQYKKPVYGGTNASVLSTGGSGIPTGIVSVPCRYIHSPAGILRTEDLQATVMLVFHFLLDFSGSHA